MRWGVSATLMATCLALSPGVTAQTTDVTSRAAAFDEIDRVFAEHARTSELPGLVFGVVADGKLAHVGAHGVQDLASRRPVGADSLFRIASMTKAFTALTVLRLRDEGKLRLDERADTYVPEMRGWTYPTADAPRIRVRDLLNHVAGFVTDDPWGDRQTPMAEADFTRLLQAGVPFARTPALEMEYSNLGYAILGRVITNVAGRPYDQEIAQTLLAPLGMKDSGFQVDAAPPDRRAQGYGRRGGVLTPEPTMGHGAFGAMGGLQTSARDYARFVAFVLAAWPARDEADRGPVRRSTVRELVQGSNFPTLPPPRPRGAGLDACHRASVYGMGLFSLADCEYGSMLVHAGGFPGYGSFVALLPQQGIGVFAFTNLTYAAPGKPVFAALAVLKQAGLIKDRELPVSSDLAAAYSAVVSKVERGDVTAASSGLAMNFLLDRDAATWATDIAALKHKVGVCDTSTPVGARSALSGSFRWACASGSVTGRILLAPTRPPTIQALELSAE